jgi:proteic killer suppression protein
MIRTFRDTSTKRFALGAPCRYSGMDEKLARRRLTQLHGATTLADLGKLNSVGLHKLKGNLRNFWSIDVNGPWRILFQFHRGDAYEVYIHDPH